MRPPLRGGRGGGGGFRGGGGGRGGGFGGRGGGGFGGRGGGGYRDEGPPEEVVGKPKSPHCCNPFAPYVSVYGRESVLILYTWMIMHIACPFSWFPAFVAMSLCQLVILVMFVARIGDYLRVALSGFNPPALHYRKHMRIKSYCLWLREIKLLEFNSNAAGCCVLFINLGHTGDCARAFSVDLVLSICGYILYVSF